MDNIYDLRIGDRQVSIPVAISSMAGVTDGAYIRDRAEYVGIGFIGGYAIDEPTISAARELSHQGREEFLPRDPIAEIAAQVALVESAGVIPGINIRASEVNCMVALAKEIGDRAIYEIDAHCRQQAMIEAGCGEYLLTNPQKLLSYVQALKITGVTVSVKIRAGVAPNDGELARLLWKAGADIIHVDLMDFGPIKLRDIRNACPVFLIANNGITDFEKAKEYFAHGADMVSLARSSDVKTLSAISQALAQFTREHGWYNSPKQLCRGGDIRSLAFCCLPVKPCPLLPALEKLKISPQDFVAMKMEGVKDTILEGGTSTCFGSLAYCCKDTTPCMFRDGTLKQAGIKRSVYMQQKRELARKIMQKIFS
ncbi:methanogenesis marker 9 domain-containing protein [uncultured Methanospirillum sp.]|uniref:methanogenesis marker 9 domain-containing protein n=1 Tax=uncultured Methanospirillum sp. TaxID=262503 RepID=UPI0029C652D6|nr:methanogenesis marker 9 domain-containing protein [uncultured Methanospirillum sp.]